MLLPEGSLHLLYQTTKSRGPQLERYGNHFIRAAELSQQLREKQLQPSPIPQESASLRGQATTTDATP